MTDEWDELESISEELSVEDLKDKDLNLLAIEYARLKVIQKETSERLSYIKEVLGAEVNEEPGEYLFETDSCIVEVKRAEKYDWDQNIIVKSYGDLTPTAPGIADCMAMEWKVNRKKFDALVKDAEKQKLIDALTVKPGLTTVKVTNKGDKR